MARISSLRSMVGSLKKTLRVRPSCHIAFAGVHR